MEEGAKRTISKKYLNVIAPDIVHFIFNITKTPVHGSIDILAPNKVDLVRGNTSFFTSDEIEQERVVYYHDDSESRRDTFHFVAMASRSQGRGHDFQYVGVFHIHVVLKNDHTPIQIVDKVFQVSLLDCSKILLHKVHSPVAANVKLTPLIKYFVDKVS